MRRSFAAAAIDLTLVDVVALHGAVARVAARTITAAEAPFAVEATRFACTAAVVVSSSREQRPAIETVTLPGTSRIPSTLHHSVTTSRIDCKATSPRGGFSQSIWYVGQTRRSTSSAHGRADPKWQSGTGVNGRDPVNKKLSNQYAHCSQAQKRLWVHWTTEPIMTHTHSKPWLHSAKPVVTKSTSRGFASPAVARARWMRHRSFRASVRLKSSGVFSRSW